MARLSFRASVPLGLREGREASDTRVVDVEHSTKNPTGSEPRLAQLRKEERSLSARRTRLHNRIDFLRSGGGGDSAEAAEQLADLERQERELSDERRDLHERIEAAEAKLSRAEDD